MNSLRVGQNRRLTGTHISGQPMKKLFTERSDESEQGGQKGPSKGKIQPERDDDGDEKQSIVLSI